MNEFYKTKKDIEAWLDKYKIKNYILVPAEKYGHTVDVAGKVDLAGKELSWIAVKFNHVEGSFYCHSNHLTSLEFGPQSVGEYFNCSDNTLTSLEFCPQNVEGSFDCSLNQLTTLEFCPQSVGRNFYCSDNPNLGELQNIEDFSLIYQEHLRYKEKKDLAQKLDKELSDKRIKNSKIKI